MRVNDNFRVCTNKKDVKPGVLWATLSHSGMKRSEITYVDPEDPRYNPGDYDASYYFIYLADVTIKAHDGKVTKGAMDRNVVKYNPSREHNRAYVSNELTRELRKIALESEEEVMQVLGALQKMSKGEKLYLVHEYDASYEY